MKKTMLSALMTGAMVFTLGSLLAVPAFASCPLKADKPCEKNCSKPVQGEFKKPVCPEEHAKMREAKKAEFEERLQLTESQKAQLEKIKADEKKTLAPYKEKIKKEEEKLDELFAKERAIRAESMKKFEATLSPEQKAELEKIKQEIKEEMERTAPNMGPVGPKGPHHPKVGPKSMCPPQCDCGCHNPEKSKAEPADCKCPCHKDCVKK